MVGLLGIYAMRDIGRYMKTATRKMICPLSSRQGAYQFAHFILFSYFKGFLEGVPAFLGYAFGVFFTLQIFTSDLFISVPGI